MAAVTHIASREIAAETLRRVHNEMAEGLMIQTDFMSNLQAGERINLDVLRQAAAKRLRAWLTAREAALAVLEGRG
jgi:hypothetical protein